MICSILVLISFGCQKKIYNEKWIQHTAPEQFTARFETSRGNFEAEFTREWSPLAVDRLYAQIKHGYYDRSLFYRVPPNFVAQFGGNDSVRMKLWKQVKIPDEPVVKGNIRGAISYARSGKDSRDNDLFINLQSNSPRLDTILSNGVKGFPALGMVTKGMEVVDSLYNGYGDKVFAKYDTLFMDKQVFLQRFPRLDSIKKVYFIRKAR